MREREKARARRLNLTRLALNAAFCRVETSGKVAGFVMIIYFLPLRRLDVSECRGRVTSVVKCACAAHLFSHNDSSFLFSFSSTNNPMQRIPLSSKKRTLSVGLLRLCAGRSAKGNPWQDVRTYAPRVANRFFLFLRLSPSGQSINVRMCVYIIVGRQVSLNFIAEHWGINIGDLAPPSTRARPSGFSDSSLESVG